VVKQGYGEGWAWVSVVASSPGGLAQMCKKNALVCVAIFATCCMFVSSAKTTVRVWQRPVADVRHNPGFTVQSRC